uniref:Uncharacterized protein n=1 Tax=Vespula pensylvanica TaxID=30213 RepID=A0A834P910_VESPE|nr:hypothetical protein H0235_005263 [Vespula pensylvanica]
MNLRRQSLDRQNKKTSRTLNELVCSMSLSNSSYFTKYDSKYVFTNKLEHSLAITNSLFDRLPRSRPWQSLMAQSVCSGNSMCGPTTTTTTTTTTTKTTTTATSPREPF